MVANKRWLNPSKPESVEYNKVKPASVIDDLFGKKIATADGIGNKRNPTSKADARMKDRVGRYQVATYDWI